MGEKGRGKRVGEKGRREVKKGWMERKGWCKGGRVIATF